MNKITQSSLLQQFTIDCREKFNEELFTRNDNDIIQEVLNVIKSCEMKRFFSIKVKSFQIVEDPRQIDQIMYAFEQQKREGTKNRNEENPLDYLHIKNTAMKLLVVNYYVECKGQEIEFPVYIQIPRFVNKYYFKIQGNYYMPMLQIVDASTYNNASAATSKKSVTLKTVFQPLRIYRNAIKLKLANKKDITAVYFNARVFNKTVPAFKYVMSKYGFTGVTQMLGIDCISFDTVYRPELDEDNYTFEKNNLFITVPKYIFDNEVVIQSLVGTVIKCINKNTTIDDIFNNPDFWVFNLGGEFSQASVEKGIKIQESIESIYDISTYQTLKLPEECKSDIYKVILWMVTNFSSLMSKNNLDVSIKQVRLAKYIASLYATKLSVAIHRISRIGKKLTCHVIKQNITTQPDYLIKAITKCTLINYSNTVNDLDAISVTKYSMKGIAGIGEKNQNVLEEQRRIHISSIGYLDPDSSGQSDPGMTGIICPMAPYKDGYFTEFEEPNTWDENFNQLMASYKSIIGLKESAILKQKVTGEDTTEYVEQLSESLQVMKKLVEPCIIVDNTAKLTRVDIDVKGEIIYGFDE